MNTKRNETNYNASGYFDPTASQAIVRADNEKPKRLIKLMQEMAHLSGYEIKNRIILKNKKTGEEYK